MDFFYKFLFWTKNHILILLELLFIYVSRKSVIVFGYS